MNSLFIKLLIILSIIGCANKSKTNDDNTSLVKIKVDDNEEGYLFVSISDIYYHNKELSIVDEDNVPIFVFSGKTVSIGNEKFDIIEQESSYNKSIAVVSYFPENDLFILKAIKLKNGNFKVTINDKQWLIDGNKYKDILTFKTPEKYVLDGYPNPTKDNPLRGAPNESSDIIANYEDYTYLSVEIKGDWLKIKDDKDCYSGEKPSETDIVGWIRWKKNGVIIIDIRHIC